MGRVMKWGGGWEREGVGRGVGWGEWWCGERDGVGWGEWGGGEKDGVGRVGRWLEW